MFKFQYDSSLHREQRNTQTALKTTVKKKKRKKTIWSISKFLLSYSNQDETDERQEKHSVVRFTVAQYVNVLPPNCFGIMSRLHSDILHLII